MDKVQLDELYHNLRQLYVMEDNTQKEAVAGITSHLTQTWGDYTGLLRFLSYYGENYILPHVVELLRSADRISPLLRFSRIVELGSGFGWLGRGISNALNQLPVVFVDKRQWIFTDIVADLETKNGVKRVLDELRGDDLVVMSELLHCLDKPEKTLQPFTEWPMLVVEYMPSSAAYRVSYDAQIARLGCKPVKNIRDVFPGSKIFSAIADPYMIWLILPLSL